MKNKLKIAYFGEHDLKNFSYCIDSSIQNNLLREELSKKIHKLQGVILIIQKTELGMNPLERYKEFTKIYVFHPEGKITFKRYNKEEKALINNLLDDDENSEGAESIRNNANNDSKLIKGKSIYNNFIDARNKFKLFPNKPNNFINLNLNASKADPNSNKISTNIHTTEEFKGKNEDLNNIDLNSNNNICIEKEKTLRIINLKDLQDVIKGMEKKHISYFYKQGLPGDNTPDDTACVIFKGRHGKKKKLEYHCFRNKKTNRLEFPKIDKTAPQGYSLFAFEKESKMVKKIQKQKKESKSNRIQNNYDLTTPYPNSENKYCYICNKKIEEYKVHFDSDEHSENLNKISYIGDSLNKTFDKIEKNNESIFSNSNLNSNLKPFGENKGGKEMTQITKQIHNKNIQQNDAHLNNTSIQYTKLTNPQANNTIRNIPILTKPQIKGNNQIEALSSANKEETYSKTSSPDFDKNNIDKLNNDKLDSEYQNTIRQISSSICDSHISSNKTIEQNSKLLNIKDNSSSKTYENYNINKISESQASLENNSNIKMNNDETNNQKNADPILNDLNYLKDGNKDRNDEGNNFDYKNENMNNLIFNHNNNNVSFTVRANRAIIGRSSEILFFNNLEANEEDFFSKDEIRKKYIKSENNFNITSNNMVLENLKIFGCSNSNLNNNEECKMNNNNFFSSLNIDKDFTECLSLREDNASKPKKIMMLDSNEDQDYNLNKNKSNKNSNDYINNINKNNNLQTELFDLKGDPIKNTDLLDSNLNDNCIFKEERNVFLNKNTLDNLLNTSTDDQDFLKLKHYLNEMLTNKNNIEIYQNLQKETASLLLENSNLFEKAQKSKLALSLPLNLTIENLEDSKINSEKSEPLDKEKKEMYLKQYKDENAGPNLNGMLSENNLLLGKKISRTSFEINCKAENDHSNTKDVLNDNIRITRTKLKDIKYYAEYLKCKEHNLNIENISNGNSNKSDKRAKKSSKNN